MEDSTTIQPNVFDQLENKLPTGLNVLTILSLIANPIRLIHSVFSYFTICTSLSKYDEAKDSSFGNLLPDLSEADTLLINLQCQHRLSVVLVNVLSASLCIMGAVLMRQRKRMGFMVFLIGTLISPIVGMLLHTTEYSWKGIGGAFVLSFIFIGLYAAQLKHLKK